MGDVGRVCRVWGTWVGCARCGGLGVVCIAGLVYSPKVLNCIAGLAYSPKLHIALCSIRNALIHSAKCTVIPASGRG